MKAKHICRLVGLMAILGAGSALAAPAPPLSPEEGRKIAPLLRVAAEPLFDASASAAPAGAPVIATLSPMAAALGARIEGGVPVADLLFAIETGGAQSLAALGITVDAVVGPVATARAVPLALVDDLARRPEITRLEPASRRFPMNDVSVPDTGAPGVWSEFGATGRGVVVGVVDTGIDVNHPDFRNADGTTRIKFLLDLSQPGSGPYGGTLLTAADINTGAVSQDVVGHGTHITGSAAGGGRADSSFRGMAPEADLVIVNADRTRTGDFTSADIVNGLSFIDQKAAELGAPYVANLSLGGHTGAHDGSALEEVAIDNLCRAGKAGKAIVIAAGNERDDPPRHAAGDLQSGSEIRFTISNYTPEPGSQNDFVLINMWYETFSGFSVTLITPNDIAIGPFAPGGSNGASGDFTGDGVIGIQNAVSGADPANGDFQCSIIVIDAGGVVPMPGQWRVRIEGDAGPFDAYIAAGTIGARFTNFVPPTGFVAEPGTARNAITVGAYMTKIEWDDKDLNHFDLRQLGFPNAVFGVIAPLSNAGPTRDGRIKPELVAPGQEIGSCFSSDAPPGSAASSFTSPFPDDYPNMFILAGDSYAIQQGTSQATPHVAGAVALLFELHPDWDIIDVKRALTSTARADAFTGVLPNNLYGYGKLDVLSAVRAAAPDTIIAGDVDGNDLLEVADVLLALDFVLAVQEPSAEELARADLNADARLDVGDLVLIVRAVAAGARPAAEPAAPAGSETWVLPIAIAAEKPVVAVELILAHAAGAIGVTPLGGSARSARAGVLAAGAARDRAGTTHLLALAVDGRSLAGGEPVILLPLALPAGDDPAAAMVPLRIDLIGPGGTRVAGDAVLGAPERASPASAAPAVLAVWPVAPNPFASPARIAFTVPGSENRRVTVGIYDVSGRLVAALADDLRAPGRHEVTWDGRGSSGRPLAAGIYWARVTAGHESASARLTVVR